MFGTSARFLDMCRTSVNVTGDCMVCTVVATSENAIDDVETVRRRLAGEVLDESPPTPDPAPRRAKRKPRRR